MPESPEYFDNITVGQYALTGVPLKVYVNGRYFTITAPEDVDDPLIGYGMMPNGEMEPFDYRDIEHVNVSGNIVDIATFKKAMEDESEAVAAEKEESGDEEADAEADEEADEEGGDEEGGDEEADAEADEEGGEEEEAANPFESIKPIPSLLSLVEGPGAEKAQKVIDKLKSKLIKAKEDKLDAEKEELGEVVNEGPYDDIDIKDIHFEIDPKKQEEMKLAYGYRLGGVTQRQKLSDAEYELKRFRKKIKYWDGNARDKDWAVGPFAGPNHYNTVNSTLGAGPHAKKIKAVSWNQKKYDQWVEDMASGDGWKHSYDMAQNATMERGLVDWVKKNRTDGEDPLKRIQWDIEALGEGIVNEAKMSKEKIENLIYSLENEKDSWHPSSDSKKKAMLDKLKKDLSKFESVNEGVMSELDILAKEAKDIKGFLKAAGKLLGSKIEGATADWLSLIYKTALASPDGQWAESVMPSLSSLMKVNEVSRDAYTLHMLANKVGQNVADDFLITHNIDMELLKKAIQQGTINKYELRDIIKGTAVSSLNSKFMKEFMKEARGRAGEELSMISKSRAKAELRQIKKGKRDDGFGKPDAKLYGVDASGDEHEITDHDEINIYKKFGLRAIEESVNEAVISLPGFVLLAIGAALATRVGLMSDEKLQKGIDVTKATAKAIVKELPIIGNKIKKKEFNQSQADDIQKYLKDELSDQDIVDILLKNPDIKQSIINLSNKNGTYRYYYNTLKNLGGAKEYGYAHPKFKALRKKIADGEIEVKESVNEGVMSKLEKLAKKAKNLNDFLKEAGTFIGGKVSGKTAKWLTSIYNNTLKTEAFGKKDDYADESGDSYKRAKDWQIVDPGSDEDTVDTGYTKVNESVISDILIIASESNTYEAFTAELVAQKYIERNELNDPEASKWLKSVYSDVNEDISLSSLIPVADPESVNEGRDEELEKLEMDLYNMIQSKARDSQIVSLHTKYKRRGGKKELGDIAKNESVNEGKYRIYMNSDADAPNEVDYEEYFGDGNKAAMIKKAKELAKDGTNQYGDPIKIAVTAEDDINDVAWTNESVNEARDFKKGDKVSYKDDDGKTKSGYIIKKMTRTFRGKKSIQYLIGKTKTTDPRLGRFDTVSTAAGKTPKNMFFRESVNESIPVNESLPPGYSKFLVSLQTLIGDIAPDAWGDKRQIYPSAVKRIHNSLKKRYGSDYKKFNNMLKTQKGVFGDWYLEESVNEDHMGAPYEYDNISEPYSIKVGDMVKNTNPSCPHNGSQGIVNKITSMPDDIGQLIKYIVTNQGDNYRSGDQLTKTVDQLEVIQY